MVTGTLKNQFKMVLPNLTARSIYMNYYNELNQVSDDARRFVPVYELFMDYRKNLPSSRADFVMTGIPGTSFHNDCRIVEFKYFKAKGATEVEMLTTASSADTEQVKRYAEDINRQFPAYQMRRYVVYIAAGKQCKVWEV